MTPATSDAARVASSAPGGDPLASDGSGGGVPTRRAIARHAARGDARRGLSDGPGRGGVAVEQGFDKRALGA